MDWQPDADRNFNSFLASCAVAASLALAVTMAMHMLLSRAPHLSVFFTIRLNLKIANFLKLAETPACYALHRSAEDQHVEASGRHPNR